MLSVPQRYRQTDRRTTYDSNTALALRASRGKKGTEKIAKSDRHHPGGRGAVLDFWSRRKSLLPRCNRVSAANAIQLTQCYVVLDRLERI